MWRFLSGGKPPKRLRTDCEETNTSRPSSVKLVRGFNPAWKAKFPWIQHDAEKNIMFCSTCRKSTLGDNNSTFVAGCGNFKIDTIKFHDRSKLHVRASESEKAKLAQPATSLASSTLKTLKKVECDRVLKLFRIAFAFAVHARPFSDFSWECELQKLNGADLGQTYLNDKECRTFVYYIAEIERRALLNIFQQVRYFSIMVDEAIDSAILSQLIIFMRITINGVVTTKFLGLVTIQGSPNSEAIYDGILKMCCHIFSCTEEEFFNKLVGIACDGAATLQGVRNGVVSKLKAKQPELVAVHCLAHRLELAFKDTMKTLPFIRKVTDLVDLIYHAYRSSALRRSQLKESCVALSVKLLVPIRVGGTRWLPHLKKAMDVILSIFPAIVMHLDQLSIGKTDFAPKAKGILLLLKSKEFIRDFLFTMDIIVPLNHASLQLQGSSATIQDGLLSISSLCSSLQKFQNQKKPDGYYSRQLSEDGTIFKEVSLCSSSKYCSGSSTKCIEHILTCINSRFPNSSSLQDIADCMKITNISNFTVPTSTGFNDFGNEEVKRLLQLFPRTLSTAHNIKAECVEHEWEIFKQYFVLHRKEMELMDSLPKDFADRVPNILGVKAFLKTLPSTSVDCERGFSIMKKTKSDWRSSLSTNTLNDLMMVQLNSNPDISVFDAEQALSLWLVKGDRPRRPSTKPYGHRCKNVDSSENSDSDESVDD